MIPVQLEIQGLYSYREKQTINFDPLTAAGLFGIFGAVGSGKSSILEAILLALYGSTERLSDRGEKNSMLNLQSDQMLIRFIFRSGKNNTQTFLARYEAKRNKKDPEIVDPATHIFYQQSGSDWEAIDAKAEEIIGMKKEHFKQTVIIPQGKFREFIDLTPGPRAKMMKELFGLERFDLSEKTGHLLRVEKDEKIRLETRLQSLEAYSEEGVKEIQTQLEATQKSWEKSLSELEKLEKILKTQENLQEKHEAWQQNQKSLAELQAQKPQIEEKRQIHRDFITAKTYLRPVWNQLQELQKDVEKYRVSITDAERFAVEFEKEIDRLQQEETALRQKNQDRPKREGKIRDLKKVLEIQELDSKFQLAKNELDQILPAIQTFQAKRKDLEREILEKETHLQSESGTDVNQLAELINQLSSWKDLLEQLAQKERLISQFEKESKNVENTLEKLRHSIPSEFETLDQWQQAQKEVINSWDENRENLLRKSGLHSHAHLLEDGEPCPLCGSLEHPNPLEKSAADRSLREIEQKIGQEKEELEKILLIRQQLKEQEIYQQTHGENLKRNRSEKSLLAEKLENLTSQLSALSIHQVEELEAFIEKLENQSQLREQNLKKLQILRKELDQAQKQLDNSQENLQKAQLKKESTLTAIQSKREEIKDPEFCKSFFSKSPERVQETIQKVERDIEIAAEELESKQKYLLEVRTKATTNLADLKNFKATLASVTSKNENLSAEFEQLKAEHGFRDEDKLIELFEHSLDAEKTAKEIQSFDQQLALVKSKIEELEQDQSVVTFDQAAFEQLQNDLSLSKNESREIQNRLTLLQEELKNTNQKLEEKKDQEKLLVEVEKRETYLRELEKLFKGSGFVKYVSSIYLRELCHTANQRFMKLSKNSLALEIDSDNTFWVIDYLNGGKKRLLKTLSGGQTFQASLCLALALAEKVKALNQADQSFFFLDEGFGALDRNSLRVVFETLKSLRHENRIVGIISHVEELQQEIGVFAQVELDPEAGSQVSYSF
ncbi:SMC family ATPase [uncultured Algoriphagus sp.]|uniref:AAA family ATPase n=1 Tax=uncultured Algoriphagus sp. TaxID=417365 RepID=UPI00259ACCAA|nr:SMC family ATPase [uncultured Algoriphagus sp.]